MINSEHSSDHSTSPTVLNVPVAVSNGKLYCIFYYCSSLKNSNNL